MLGDEVVSSLCRFDRHLSVVLVGDIGPGLLERGTDSLAQITPINVDDLADVSFGGWIDLVRRDVTLSETARTKELTLSSVRQMTDERT
jgi:hypothetical protein